MCCVVLTLCCAYAVSLFKQFCCLLLVRAICFACFVLGGSLRISFSLLRSPLFSVSLATRNSSTTAQDHPPLRAPSLQPWEASLWPPSAEEIVRGAQGAETSVHSVWKVRKWNMSSIEFKWYVSRCTIKRALLSFRLASVSVQCVGRCD